MNLSAYASPSVNLATNTATGIGGTFSGINNIIGSGASSLSGLGDTTITGSNAGTSGGVSFSGFGSFTGTGTGTFANATGSHTWNITNNAGTVSGNSFSGYGSVVGGNADVFVFGNTSSISGNLAGGGNSTLDVSAITSPTVNLSTNTASGIGGTFSGINNFLGAGSNSTLIGPAGNTTWYSGSADSGTVGSMAYNNFGNVTGGGGANTFVFGNASVISGMVNGGSGSNNTIDFGGYSQPLTLTLTSNTSGNFKNGLVMVANFANFNNVVGPTDSAIKLPAMAAPNNLVFKPTGGTSLMARLNNAFNFNFDQFTSIYGGPMGDIVDLSHVKVNNPFATPVSNPAAPITGLSITYSIDDPINVTFLDINTFTLPFFTTSSNTGNVTETLTQGVTQGNQALDNAPSSQTANSNPTSMLTTATQAIDTAFGNTSFSKENASGGCGGNTSSSTGTSSERKTMP